MYPYNQSIKELEIQYVTDSTHGLSEAEVIKRQKKYGFNTQPKEKPESWIIVFLKQFQSPLIYILVCAAVIIFLFTNDPLDAVIISGVLTFNAIIGTVQEGRTRRILENLKQYIKSSCFVIRDGKRMLVDDAQLVVGDLIELKEGQRVAADARIVFGYTILVDESLLTGESRSCHKDADVLSDQKIIADQTNMVFRGTYITSGYGTAIVVAIGKNTEIGKIQKTVATIHTDMPLKKEVDRLAYVILLFVFAICGLLFFIGMLAGKPLAELLVMLTALFICVVPEGLPVVLTLVLVSGVYKLTKHNVVVKNLQAVEALGRANVIVLDKTGTLTRNEMMVSHVLCAEKMYRVTGDGYYKEGEILSGDTVISMQFESEILQQLIIACALLGDVQINQNDDKKAKVEIKGDPTEAALLLFSQKGGADRKLLLEKYHSLYEIPFSPTLKLHAHFFEYNTSGIIFVSGAPEAIMQRAQHISEYMQNTLSKMLDDGLRVVAIGMKSFDSAVLSQTNTTVVQNEQALKKINNDLTVLGFVGIQDAARKDISDTIAAVRDTGMQIVMATGDHEKTALFIAKNVGIYEQGDHVLDGRDLMNETDMQLKEQLKSVTVYSRMSPDDKLRIIQLFRLQKNIVAMVGDGINDSPALVAADLGIAMGGAGAQVAQQAADIVLLDDSFLNVVNAIKQGRHIFYALKRVILYFFATNMGEILIILFALVANIFNFDFPLPITAAQILWLNLITDGFLDVALSMEPQEKEILEKGWLQPHEHLVDINVLLKMFFVAIPMGIAGMYVFLVYVDQDVALARTMVLITLAMFQWFNAWNCRSLHYSIFHIGILSNRWLVRTTVFVLFLQLCVVYLPFMQYIFKTVPLTFAQWAVGLGLSFPIIVIEELRKLCVRMLW